MTKEWPATAAGLQKAPQSTSSSHNEHQTAPDWGGGTNWDGFIEILGHSWLGGLNKEPEAQDNNP